MAMGSSIRFYLACLVYQSVCFSRSETVFPASEALKTQAFAPHGDPCSFEGTGPTKSTRDASLSTEYLV